MAIPLPALDVKTPQQPDLVSQYGQLLQLKNMQAQQQMQQQEAPLRLQALQQGVQSGQLDVQQKQQAQKDQQAMTASMNQWDGKSLDELVPLVLKNGGSASAVMGLKQHALDQRAKMSAIAKDDAQTGKNNIDTAMKKNDAVSGALGSILQVPDEQLPQALSATAQQLAQQGLIDPEHVQMAQQLAQSGDPKQIRQQLDIMRKGITSNSQLMEQAKADQMAANEDAMRQQAAATAAETARHNRVDERASGQRIGIEGARLAFDKQRQGTQDSQAIDAQAQQIASGDVKGLPQSRNNPYSRAVMQRVYEINPQYSDELYSTKQDFLSSKGKANLQVQSLNKLAAHIGELQQASDKAGFSPVGFTGAGKSLRLAEQLFGKEDVKFLSGVGVGTEGELNAMVEKTHSPLQSVRNEAITTLSRFTADAARQLGDQYERGTKLKFDPNQHFTPETVKMLNASGGTSARPQQGNAGNSFSMTATGANGHKIGSNDGGNTWIDVQTGKKVQ